MTSPSVTLIHSFTLHISSKRNATTRVAPLQGLRTCMRWTSVSLFFTYKSLKSLTHEEQEAWELKWARARKRERLWMNPGSRAQQELSESASGHAKPRRGAKLRYECGDDQEEMKRGFALLAGIKMFLTANPKLVACRSRSDLRVRYGHTWTHR